MATFDAHKNFAVTQVLTAPSPAISGTSLVVSTGGGALFPAAPFNCVVYPSATYPLNTSAEIVRVTSIVGDTLTIVRAQEGSSARTIIAGDTIGNVTSAKVFTDIENAINALPQSAIQSVSIGTNAASGPTIVFSNSNNVSFGLNGSVITASAAGGGGGAAISAGANSQSSGTIVFSNSNGISFGLSTNGVLTASHNGITSQSVQTQSNVQGISAGTQVGRTGDIVFSNLNGITFGMINNSQITASYTVPSTAGLISAINVSGGTTSNNLSAVTFSNLNGVSFGLNGSVITASVGAGAAPGSVSAGTTSVALGQIVFSNSNNISFGINGSTLTASVDHMNIGVSTGGNTGGTTGTIDGSAGQYIFFGGNNITLSQSVNAQSVTLSIIGASGGGAAGSIAAGGSTLSLGQVVFSNSNNISFGINGSTLTASATVASSQGSINFSAGTTSNNLSAITFSNSNGVTFGLNGSVVTASVAAGGGGGVTQEFYEPFPLFATSFSSLGQNTIYFDPFIVNNSISVSSFRNLASMVQIGTSSNTTVTGQHGYTHGFAVYSRSVTDSAASNFSASTNLVTMFSSSNTISAFWSATSQSVSITVGWGTGTTNGNSSVTFSGVAAGLQNQSFNSQKISYGGMATSFSAGEYWFAQAVSSSTLGGAAASSLIRVNHMVATIMTNGSWAEVGQVSSTSLGPYRGLGIYSVTSASFPTSVGLNQISNQSFNKRYWQFQA